MKMSGERQKRNTKNPFCQTCKTKPLYDEKFDAYYCFSCDVWCESKCSEPTCYFCASRPDKPVKSSYTEKSDNAS